jgi:hypothetical protein
LARVRESDDPDAIGARERRNEAIRRRMLELRDWERVHGKPDWGRYESEVMPLIEAGTPAGLARMTGLSTHHCWQVRKGLKRLHPMHWSKILVGQTRSSGRQFPPWSPHDPCTPPED